MDLNATEEYINEQVEQTTLNEAYAALCINMAIYHKIAIKEGRSFEKSYEMMYDYWDNAILFVHKDNTEDVKNFIFDRIRSLTHTEMDGETKYYKKIDDNIKDEFDLGIDE